MPLTKAPQSINPTETPVTTAKRSRPTVRRPATAKVADVAAVKTQVKASATKSPQTKIVVAELLEKPQKLDKAKKPKLVRDSFTMPKLEYAEIELLKLRALKLEQSIKKGEILRAGIKALAAMPDKAFLAALAEVPTLKTGRPRTSKP